MPNKTYRILGCHVVFLADSFEYAPSKLEEAWRIAESGWSALCSACAAVAPQYSVPVLGSKEKEQEAVGKKAMTAVATYLGQQSVLFTVDPDAAVYKPGGLGHGGSSRLITKTNGNPYPPVSTTSLGDAVVIEPFVHVWIGDEVP